MLKLFFSATGLQNLRTSTDTKGAQQSYYIIFILVSYYLGAQMHMFWRSSTCVPWAFKKKTYFKPICALFMPTINTIRYFSEKRRKSSVFF